MSFGTLLYTWLAGEKVGTDEFGNSYYKASGGRLHGRERRWVIFKGDAEASKVPPEWHSWLHHTTAEPLVQKATEGRPWQKPHQPNPTGTPEAYWPKGHEYLGGKRARATGDYRPWTPD